MLLHCDEHQNWRMPTAQLGKETDRLFERTGELQIMTSFGESDVTETGNDFFVPVEQIECLGVFRIECSSSLQGERCPSRPAGGTRSATTGGKAPRTKRNAEAYAVER